MTILHNVRNTKGSKALDWEHQENPIQLFILCQNFILKSLKTRQTIYLRSVHSSQTPYLDPSTSDRRLFALVYPSMVTGFPNKKVLSKSNQNQQIMISSMFSLSFNWCVSNNPRPGLYFFRFFLESELERSFHWFPLSSIFADAKRKDQNQHYCK